MNIDDFVKILLAVSISFAIIGVSYQIMKLIGKLSNNLDEVNHSVGNLNKFSEKLLEDYDFISGEVKALTGAVGNIGRNIIDPIVNLFGFLKQFKK
jgi:hypothetical protein